MAAPQRPEQGHSRHPSSDTRRVAMPRRSTKGPLDVDVSAIPTFQPPTPALQTALPPSPAPTSMPVRTASPASSLLSPTQQNPASVRTRSKSPAARTMQLDLSLLLRPSLYAPVPTTHLAAPFLDASNQPPPDTDLETLLSQRRFIHAADKATDILTSGSISPSDTQRILDLLRRHKRQNVYEENTAFAQDWGYTSSKRMLIFLFTNNTTLLIHQPPIPNPGNTSPLLNL
ncbi:hypothetical protein KCU71_g4081, partial [Aureobasidium melanogenum]